MTTLKRLTLAGTAATLLLSGSASAAVIDITIGAQDFADGAILTSFQFSTASSGEPSPFDAFRGSDPSGPDFAATWSYSYLLDPTDVFVSASIEFGITDHDSAQTGSQLASFSVDGNDLTSNLNALFEMTGEGAAGQYDVYLLPIPASAFAGLADGSATFSLTLQGPGLGILGATPNNGAGLDFARLRLETTPSGGPVPEPATSLSLLVGVVAVSAFRSRRRRA